MVVFDCNVMLAAIGWHGSPRLCLTLAARRRILLCVTADILAEYETIIPKRLKEGNVDVDAAPTLSWVRDRSRGFEAVPLGKQRSRNAKDDPYIACALAAKADFIVTYDRDLPALGKPFGIEVIRPAELLRRIKGQ